MTRLACALIVFSLSNAPVSQQQPTFRGAVDLVTVSASVQDGLRVVTGLEASDFQVLDNGVPQEVATISYGKLPIDVTVALDVSGSVSGAPLARLQHGVLQLQSDLSRDDRLKLMAFSQVSRRIVDFSADPQAIEQAVTNLSGSGGTAIFDALTVAMLAPTDPSRRQLVTVFTDGADNVSVTEPSLLLEAGRRAQTSITAVLPLAVLREAGLAPPVGGGRLTGMSPARISRPPGERPETALSQQVRLIDQLVTLTGGRLIGDPGPPVDLGTSFRQALDAFRSSYVLYFTPRGVERGGFHALHVTVRGHASYTIRARSGYFGT